jgi:hypothetical protein
MKFKRALTGLLVLAAIAGAVQADPECDTTLEIVEIVFSPPQINPQGLAVVVENPESEAQEGVVRFEFDVDGEEVIFGVPITVGPEGTLAIVLTTTEPFTLVSVFVCDEWPTGTIESPDPFGVQLVEGKGA